MDRAPRTPSPGRSVARLGGHTTRLQRRWPAPGEIVYVGQAGIDDTGASYIDDYGNTQSGLPFTDNSPVFTNGTNLDPINEPVCFWLGADGHVHPSGAFTDVAPGDPVFTFPEHYRPFQRCYLVLATAVAAVTANGYVDPDGVFIYLG